MDGLQIAGPTLAALLESALASGAPCDGLLFGGVRTTTSTHAHDAGDALLVRTTRGRVDASLASAGTHSFYSSSGEVQGDRLQQLLAGAGSSQQQLLGWFSCRPDSPAVPSIREAAVCERLAAWLASSRSAGGQALVFGLVTSTRDHNGATISLQLRFFVHRPQQQREPGGGAIDGSAAAPGGSSSSGGNGRAGSQQAAQQHPSLAPLELEVLNLGQHAVGSAGGGGAAAGSSTPAAVAAAAATGAAAADAGAAGLGRPSFMQLPALASALDAPGSSVLSLPQRRALLGAAAAAAAPDAPLALLEGLYHGLLEELQLSVAAVADKQPALAALRQQAAGLRQQLRSDGSDGAARPAVLAAGVAEAARGVEEQLVLL